MDECTCVAQGPLLLAPDPVPNTVATFVGAGAANNPMRYNDLCTWTCSRGYCPEDVCSSNVGCVSGSGDGNYEGLCSFSCGRGFCPPPCNCTELGTPPALTADPTILGIGADGLDHATYDPLCNFTCTHGYCPWPNACELEITANPDLTASALPPLPTLEDGGVPLSADVLTYSAGDFVTFESDGDGNVSLDVLFIDQPNTTAWTPSACDDSKALFPFLFRLSAILYSRYSSIAWSPFS
jgi:hypothetical protein